MFEPFEEDDESQTMYENGHWEWGSMTDELIFVNDEIMSEEELHSAAAVTFGKIEFKDDLDLLEQQRFRKRFQRKPQGEEDVVYLQDIKDVVLYTAPSSLLTASVVNLVHHPATERFIRALILYCQYYLQTTDEMGRRMLELETKIRTSRTEQIELELRDNVEDLRLLVANEYVNMILCEGDLKKYHHMGPEKKLRSLSKKDLVIFESILRISIQIVWLALGRTSFYQIELEVNRMFKSQIFNMVEHKLNTKYISKMMPYERFVLLGHCLSQGQKLNTMSPLVNELLCSRPIDFRLIGLASIHVKGLPPRLRYLEQSLSLNERLFQDNGIVLGILGLQRIRFDTMLREIKMITSSSSSSASMRARSVSRTSRASIRKSTIVVEKLFREISLPRKKYDKEWIPNEFPTKSTKSRYSNQQQRLKWLARAAQLTGRPFATRKTNKLKRS